MLFSVHTFSAIKNLKYSELLTIKMRDVTKKNINKEDANKRDIRRKQNLKIMRSFDIKTIPELDTCVLGALELFNSEKIPKISIKYQRPLVVGSGNAEATARIIFLDKDAVFA